MTKLEARKNEVWMIFPEDAERLLRMNYKGNRKILNNIVERYANDMANGNWGDTPNPLIFTKGGILLDGQHRLQAVIRANVPVVFEVRIVPDDWIFKYLDNGKARTVVDYVETKYKSAVASVAAFAYCATYGQGGIATCWQGVLRQYKIGNNRGKIRVDRIGLAKYANDHREGLEQIAVQAKRMANATGCGGIKNYGVALWLIKTLDSVDLSDEFVDEFCKTAPDSKTVSAGKLAIIRAYNGTQKPTFDWVIGMLLDIYKKFVDCTGTTRFTSWRTTFESYDDKLLEMRGKRNHDTER